MKAIIEMKKVFSRRIGKLSLADSFASQNRVTLPDLSAAAERMTEKPLMAILSGRCNGKAFYEYVQIRA